VGFDAIIPKMLSSLSPVIIAIVVVLVLSASMSTLSSLVLTSGSTITLDFIAPLRKNKATEKKNMLLIRAFIALFIIISAVIAIYQAKSPNLFIAQMMGVSWGALAGAFLAPFLYGLYWKGVTKASVAVSFAFGVGMELFQLAISLNWINVSQIPVLNFIFQNSLYSGVFAMGGGLILVPVVSLLSKKTLPAGVGKMFLCYEKTATVNVKESLGK
jgi:SSS family solute:Na+ symporter